MKRVVQDRWIDIALMICAENGGAAARQVLAARDPIGDPCQGESELHANVTEHVEVLFRPGHVGDQHPGRRDDQDVEGNDNVGDNRAEGREQHARAIISEKARWTVRASGLGSDD